MKLNIQMVFEVAVALSRTGNYQDNGPSLILQPRVLKQLKVKSLRRDQIDINNGLHVPFIKACWHLPHLK